MSLWHRILKHVWGLVPSTLSCPVPLHSILFPPIKIYFIPFQYSPFHSFSFYSTPFSERRKSGRDSSRTEGHVGEITHIHKTFHRSFRNYSCSGGPLGPPCGL